MSYPGYPPILDLFRSFPHDPAEIRFTREQYARRGRRFYEQFVALDSKMTPLLGTIPLLVPGDLYFSDEVMPFDAVCAGVSEH
jgi:hypothetical protein